MVSLLQVLRERNDMNNSTAPTQEGIPTPTASLLDTIKAIRASVGDGLNDDELTRLLRQTGLPTEAGFAFLSFCGGCVTLTVPQQELKNWYPERGWIAPEKETVARALAETHKLSLYEPPDIVSSCLYPQSGAPESHHHLELSNRRETVVVAHPQYLKIRLYGATAGSRSSLDVKGPLPLCPGLLRDLAAIYRA